MNMGGISEQESTPFPELVRDAVMNVIGRKPVHACDLERHPPHDKCVDIIPCQRLALCQGLIAHGADQPNASIIFEWKKSQKIALVQTDMYLPVHERACRLGIGDIENVLIPSAGKADLQCVAHSRMGTIAARDVDSTACVYGSIRPLDP